MNIMRNIIPRWIQNKGAQYAKAVYTPGLDVHKVESD